jgi:hypothetical protein
MQTRRANDKPLEEKTWQVDTTSKTSHEGYLYYCILCDEALVLSRHQIHPRKIQLVFEGTCPGCGFELDRVLGCAMSSLPGEKRLLTSLKCKDPDILVEPEESFQSNTHRVSLLSRDSRPHLTLGIDSLDKILVLKRGQFISLLGEKSHTFSLLFIVRAILPVSQGGLDGNVVFIDGGNIFDIYTVSQHGIGYGLSSETIHERIHLSRAFTHHQLYSLMVEKLPVAVDSYNAKLVIVSDITMLFSDPDVRDKKQALALFNKSLRCLGMIAEQKNIIVIATNLQTRNRTMENALVRIPHVSSRLNNHGAYTQLAITRHPFLPENKEEIVTLDNQTLSGYL